MKNLTFFLVLFFGNLMTLQAQDVTDPHHPSLEEQMASTSKIEISNATVSKDLDVQVNRGSQIFICTNDQFFYLFSFEDHLTARLENLISKEIGEPIFSLTREKIWNEINGRKIENFEIFLQKGKIKIIYKNPSEEDMELLKKLVEQIKTLTEGETT